MINKERAEQMMELMDGTIKNLETSIKLRNFEDCKNFLEKLKTQHSVLEEIISIQRKGNHNPNSVPIPGVPRGSVINY